VIDMSWRDQAACRNKEPDLFFPIGTSGPALTQLAEAKSVCHGCPVASKCLAWALETGQNSGVWGGMSEDERRQLRQAPCPGVVVGSDRVVLLVKRRAPRSWEWFNRDPDRADDPVVVGRALREPVLPEPDQQC
jgi:WhiB family redox-sensing transcriptional regulator